MTTSFRRRLAGASVATLLGAATPLLLPAQGEAASALLCRAHMSDATPRQYTNDYVHVKTASDAYVRTVAHYKTTDTSHRTRAGKLGYATVRYYISGATAGYRVYVDVYVHKGTRTGHCLTSFVPHS